MAEVGGSRIQLSQVMATYFRDALLDSPVTSPRDIYLRFMVWPHSAKDRRPATIYDRAS